MSFILDALRKSENARLRQEHPAMFDARPVAARRRFPAWFLALGLLLGLNLLALLHVLLRDERSAAAAPPDAAPVATTAPVAAAAPGSAASPAAPPSMPPSMPPSVPSSVSAPADTPAAAATRSSAVPTAPAAPAARGASPGPLAGAPAVAPVRTRDDLLAAGDAVPETRVSLHVYDPDPGKRFVFLDGQRLREGEVAANGLRVERIDADGVVLDHRGSDFKVPLEP